MSFEMSNGFCLSPKHLGTRDFSRTSCQNTDMHLRLDWPRGRQNSNRYTQAMRLPSKRPRRPITSVGVALVRIAVDRRALNRGFHIALLVADERLSDIEALDALAFSPSSHGMLTASSAVFACHQVSATTAIALSPTRTRRLTPGMVSAFAASRLFTLP